MPEPESTSSPGGVVIDPELAIPTAPSPLPVGTDAASQQAVLQIPAVQASVDALAKQLGIAPDQIVVVSVEEVEWPDGCLGVRTPDVMCLQVITPGFRVTLSAGGATYVYHTDASGRQVILATRP